MISRYLESLSAELRVPRRLRARILAEARDHLHTAVAARLERGVAAAEAESEAVEAFGDPRELAARFHQELASSSARGASARTALVMGAFVVALAAAAFGPADRFPFGLVIWIGAQLAVVAGVLGVARWLRYRSAGAVPAARLADLHRANGLAVVCVALVSVAEGGEGLVAGEPAVAIASAGMLAGALAAGHAVARAIARARALPALPAVPDEDALDDLWAVARQACDVAEKRAPLLASTAARLGREALRLRERSPALARWLDPRRSPWRFCLLFAGACGVALALQHGFADGGLSFRVENAGKALLAALVIASIEATAVIACFAAFGRFLGIRR
jgi:hypothetical protein